MDYREFRNSVLGVSIFLGLLFGFTVVPVFAVPACPKGVEVVQPDGTKITVYLRGDEYLHWTETSDGHPVTRSPQTGQWVYAEVSSGNIVPTDRVVGKTDSGTLAAATPAKETLIALAADRRAKRLLAATAGPALAARTGTMQNLVVLVNFSDLAITYSRQSFDDLFNQANYTTDGAAGSVQDFYHQVSFDNLTVQSTVVEAVTLDHGYAYYGGNDSQDNDLRPREMVQEALAKLAARGFNFSTVDGDGDGWVDGLDIIHAGGGEEYGGNDTNYIWSHQWALSSPVTYNGVRMQTYHTEPARRGWDSTPSTQGITRIGVICHETGHFLGLPDLYDYTYTSKGVGDFCLMAGGSWNGNYGTTPSYLSAWCRSLMGWSTITTLTGGGAYTLPQVETSGQVYKLQGPFSANEYFLIENRQGVGFDAALPGTSRGILIWHIDENQSNNDNKSHYMVDLEEASGTQHLELNQNDGDDSDYFRSGNATSFTNATTPNNLSYSGQLLGLNVAGIGATGSTMSFNILTSAPTINPSPANLVFTALRNGANPASQTLSIANAGGGTLNWTLSKTAAWLTLNPTSGSCTTGTSTVTVSCATGSLAAGTYNDTITITASGATNTPQTIPVTFTIVSGTGVIFSQLLDTNPGWTTSGQWAWGTPTGGGGTLHGYPDPAAGYTGIAVYGVNLNGDYSTSVGGPYYLTTPAINCANYTGVHLKFQRWLNTDYPPYVTATVEVSTNASTWISVYANSSTAVTDNSWQLMDYDISTLADGKPAVYVRWGYAIGSTSSVWPYSGWNVDDIQLTSVPPVPVDEDFETGNFSKWPWTTGGNANWTPTSASKHGGTFSAKAGTIADSQSTWMEVTLTREAGNISFFRQVSSESGYDFLRFKIDGVEKENWSGEQAWNTVAQTYAVTAGTHTYRWEYTKDSSVSNGSDTAWVDDITFPPALPATVTGTITYTPFTGFPLDHTTIEFRNGANQVLESHPVTLSGTEGSKTYSFTTALTGGPYLAVIPNTPQTGWFGQTVSNVNISTSANTTVNFNLAHARPGDADMDGQIDVSDLGILAANYGTTTGATWDLGDFNGDGQVDVSDLGILAANYGGSTATPALIQNNQEVDVVKNLSAPENLPAATKNAQPLETQKEETPSAQSSGPCGSSGLALITALLFAAAGLTPFRPRLS